MSYLAQQIEARQSAWHAAKALLDAAAADKRDLTAEEEQSYSRIMADIDARSQRIADLDAPQIGWRGRSLDASFFRLLINHAPPRFSRDLRVVHRQLVRSGHAQWMGDPPPQVASHPVEDGLARAVARIRGLFGL